VDKLQVDRLAKAVDLTDEMCVDLQTGLENARNLLKLLEEKTQQVFKEVDAESTNEQASSEAKRNDNLFSLSAYR
jgi:ATP-dependent Clp protease ATP-binding subunit ClpA